MPQDVPPRGTEVPSSPEGWFLVLLGPVIDLTRTAQHQRCSTAAIGTVGGPSASLLRWLLLTCRGRWRLRAYAMAHDELEERAMAKMRVVIYLRGEDDGELDDAEKRCSEHAERFGWQVLDVTRHKAETAADLSQLVLKVSKLRAQIIVTDTLDMLSPDAAVRDGFMEAIERQQCIVHPVNMPASPYNRRIGRRCRRSGD